MLGNGEVATLQPYCDIFERLLKEKVYTMKEYAGYDKNDLDISDPWGYGLGSLGHKAAESGFTACADGNYFKTLAELGIIAFLMFMSMIYKALTTYFKNSFLS